MGFIPSACRGKGHISLVIIDLLEDDTSAIVLSSFGYAIDTPDTTRILGDDAIAFNIYATKMVYPSKEVDWRPNAVILVPLTTYHYGLLASPIIHFPINAPILFTNPYSLPPEIFAEIMRLSPTGRNVPAKVIIVGPICPMIEIQLRSAGLSTMRILR